ncbi:MAG: tetratricopeptide repeat protein [gamma proteobacterium symbiont of Taylorina sp.]|nr:tetratricopeptide repeat protein [gamma proteobacterium symbiont of Taylorina sp.]
MDIPALKKLLEQGQDSVILRFGLGNALFKSGQAADAIPHLKAAIEFDPKYSAAWKILGKALVDVGDKEQAIVVYENGLLVAEEKGDRQAVKEINVFLKRLLK